MAESPGCKVAFRSFPSVYDVCKEKRLNKLISILIAFKKKYSRAVTGN